MLECSLLRAFLSAGRQACVCMCLAYVHMLMDSSLCSHLVCRPGWMLLGSMSLCEDAKGMHGWDEIHGKSVRGSMSGKVPRPHQDLRDAVEDWGRRTQRARKAQGLWPPSFTSLGGIQETGVSLCPRAGKGFPIAAPYPLTMNHASNSSLLSALEQWLAAGWGGRKRVWIRGLPGHLGRGEAEGNGGLSQEGSRQQWLEPLHYLPT